MTNVMLYLWCLQTSNSIGCVCSLELSWTYTVTVRKTVSCRHQSRTRQSRELTPM
jgi:hypothetical protein